MPKATKFISLLTVIVLISVMILASPTHALISQNLTSWFWTSDTNVTQTVVGDVNGDGKAEIITGGYYNDGTRFNSQLVVWDPATFTVKNVASWFWTENTEIASVAIGDVDGDGAVEIITGGAYFDGTRFNTQLCIWNGSTLALEKVLGWFWTGDSVISSVAVANITGGLGLDIVTGGAYHDGTRWNAQLCTFNGATLALEHVQGWFWTGSTYINSVATGDIDGNGAISIVTGGTYFDGTRNVGQIAVWNGTTFAAKSIQSWFTTGDTEVNSVAVANVTGGAALSIIAGGDYSDLTRLNSQLTVWNGSTMALQSVLTWFTIANTKITSVAAGNLTSSSNLDIMTAGAFYDGTKNNAQLMELNGATLATTSSTSWFVTGDTVANSVAIGNTTGVGNRIVTADSHFDTIRSVAEIVIWG